MGCDYVAAAGKNPRMTASFNPAFATGRRTPANWVDRSLALEITLVCIGSIAGLHERRVAGSTIHEIGLPESGYPPPAPYAALQTSVTPARRSAQRYDRAVKRAITSVAYPAFLSFA